jgi:hypothetical protein
MDAEEEMVDPDEHFIVGLRPKTANKVSHTVEDDEYGHCRKQYMEVKTLLFRSQPVAEERQRDRRDGKQAVRGKQPKP